MDMNGIVDLGECGITHNGGVSFPFSFCCSFSFLDCVVHMGLSYHAEGGHGMFILVSLLLISFLFVSLFQNRK